MPKYLTNNFPILNLHLKPSNKSEIVSQIIYGENFTIIRKTSNWLKVKIKEDGYKGFIKKRKFKSYFKPTHKVKKLFANVYSSPSKRKKNIKLSFCSKIKVVDRDSRFLKFEKGWISKSDVAPISFKSGDIFKDIQIFKGIKYKWGGKSFKGIDCSALVQLCLNFNNKKCPRDTKDQMIYFKKNINLKKN